MNQKTLILLSVALGVSMSITLTPLKTYGTTTIYRTQTIVNCAKGKLDIDADGSPHAYHPNGSPPGLDYLANAGKPGNWWGLATDNAKPSGNPIIQGSSDLAPGFYVSTTALQDTAKSYKSPLAYVNSETVPFIVIPGSSSGLNWIVGDFATVCYGSKCYHAIVGDIGPSTKFGEASMKLASALSINNNPKSGGVGSGVSYIVYTGTRTMRPQTIPTDSQIQTIGANLFKQYDGNAILDALKSKLTDLHPEISLEQNLTVLVKFQCKP